MLPGIPWRAAWVSLPMGDSQETPLATWPDQGLFFRPILPGDPHTLLQEDGQVLRIISSHLGDEGQYQCVAFSPAGQQTKDFRLSIHCESSPFQPYLFQELPSLPPAAAWEGE